MLHARKWAEKAGVVFAWIRTDDFYKGRHLWRCEVYVGEERVGFCDGWDSGTANEPHGLTRVWGESHLALRLMSRLAVLLGDEDVD